GEASGREGGDMGDWAGGRHAQGGAQNGAAAFAIKAAITATQTVTPLLGVAHSLTRPRFQNRTNTRLPENSLSSRTMDVFIRKPPWAHRTTTINFFYAIMRSRIPP